MPVPLLPLVTTAGSAVWNSCVNAFNSTFGRTMTKKLEGQQLAHQKELQEKQIVAQFEIKYMRTMSQIKLQQNNQELKLGLRQNNQEFKQKLEIAHQEFQDKIVEYQYQKNRKLQEFIKTVNTQIVKSNQEFKTWLFKQQKKVQIELSEYNQETQYLNAVYQREIALEIKELDNWPLKNYPWQILQCHQGINPIPVQIILAPPEVDYDRFENINSTSKSEFPKVEKRLSQYLKNFLQKHYSVENEQRPTELIDHAWESNRFAGGSAVKTIFSRLKSEPIVLIESEVDGDFINIQLAYWSGGQEVSPFYKTIISNLHYPKIIYEFAIQRALHWEVNVKQKLLAQGISEEEINQEYGGDNLLNLQVYRKYEQEKLAGIEFERHYKTNREDFDKLSALLGAYHNIIVGLFTDIHYLIHTNLSPKLPELLPELETEFSIDQRLADELLKMVVESYIGSLRAMEKDRSELVPEFAVDIALSLTGLSNPTWAEQMLDFALESWLNSRYLSVENGKEKFDIVAENLLPLDREFMAKVNQCMVSSAQGKNPSLINSTFEVVTVNNSENITDHIQEIPSPKIEDLGNGIELEMIYIPGGIFIMGSPENEEARNSNESPQHQVILQPFYMSKYPITQNQYQAIMGNNPSSFEGESRPVEYVSWHDAVEFCQKLSSKIGKIYTLPSESQWEYACRAGTATPFYFQHTVTSDLLNYNGTYPYGNAPRGEYRRETTDVGIFPPNAFGLYDMHGNVSEWCQDIWHNSYNGAPTDGSAWESGGNNSYRVLRGGSWSDSSRYCRCAGRVYSHADIRNNSRGFRIILSVKS